MAASSSSHEQQINQFIRETYDRVVRTYCQKYGYLYYISDSEPKSKDSNILLDELVKQKMIERNPKSGIKFARGVLSCKEDSHAMKCFELFIKKQFKKSCKNIKLQVQYDEITNSISCSSTSQGFYVVMKWIMHDDESETFELYTICPQTDDEDKKYKRIVNFCNAKYEIKQRYHDMLVKVVDEYARNTEKHETPKITIVPENALECNDLCSLQHGINSSTKDTTVYEDGSLNEHGIEDVLNYLAKSFICSLVPLSNNGFDFKIIRSYIDVESNFKTPTATLYITTDHHIIAIEKEEEKHEKEDQQEEEEKGIKEKKNEKTLI